MSSTSQAVTRTPAEVVRLAPVSQASNGICYSVMGEVTTAIGDLERMVNVVPRTIAAALNRKAYYFVPLTLNLGDETMFADLVWKQVDDKARGETSLDAYELRKVATTNGPEAEKAKHEYLLAAFADAIAVYTLSLYLDVDYQDLRERDYPLLAPNALAERLRKISELFPPNPGFEFAVYHRRRQQ